MGSLGDVPDQRSAWAQKKFLKKTKIISFFNSYGKSKLGFEICFLI